MIRKYARHPIAKAISSMWVLNACLFLLAVLTFWGTIYQVEHGLYEAQQRFFNSWVILVFDFIPFPGGQLTMWVLFANLVAVALFRFTYTWSRIGIYVTHIGLLLFFGGAFITYHYAEETFMALREGEAKNTSASYREWELSVFKTLPDGRREVVGVATEGFVPGYREELTPFGLTLEVRTYAINARPLQGQAAPGLKNDSGITGFEPVPPVKGEGENSPAGQFALTFNGQTQEVLLSGYEERGTVLDWSGQIYMVQLRRQQSQLPFQVTLYDFKKDEHPGTSMAKSYESRVRFEAEGIQRDAVISMNKPLRYKDYTLFQSSYSTDRGVETSILAVVKNTGKLLPYWASGLTFAGLLIHFGVMIRRGLKRRQSA